MDFFYEEYFTGRDFNPEESDDHLSEEDQKENKRIKWEMEMVYNETILK